jgi:hypothetical protein
MSRSFGSLASFCSRVLNFRGLFPACCAVTTLAFLIPRVAFFVDYRLPLATFDSLGYLLPVAQIFAGEWPDFTLRTPGYPLFLAGCHLISSDAMLVVILQTSIGLASALFLQWVVFKVYPRLLLGVTLALIPHVAQRMLLVYDFELMSESFYASFLLCFVACFLLALHRRSSCLFFLWSVIGGLCFLIRPVAQTLLVNLILVFVFLLANGYDKKLLFWSMVPMPSLILMTGLYNFAISNYPGSSVLGQVSSVAVTASFCEPDPKFSDELNARIRALQASIPDKEKTTLSNSWNPWLLGPIYLMQGHRAFSLQTYPGPVVPLPGCLWSLGSADQIASCVADFREGVLAYSNVVPLRAILTHPRAYAKFYWTSLCLFGLDDLSDRTEFFPRLLRNTYEDHYLRGGPIVTRFIDKLFFAEYDSPPPGFFTNACHLGGDGEQRHLVFMPTVLYKFGNAFCEDVSAFFGGPFWLGLYIIILSASFCLLVRSRFQHGGAFVVLTIGSIHLVSILAASLISIYIIRYPIVTRFTIYLSVAFVPLLFDPMLSLQGRRLSEDSKAGAPK